MGQSQQPQPSLYVPPFRPSTNPYDLNENRKPYWFDYCHTVYLSFTLIKKDFLIIIFINLKLTMHSSFQSTTYNHSLQAQILGPSSLKIFAG